VNIDGGEKFTGAGVRRKTESTQRRKKQLNKGLQAFDAHPS